MKIRNFNRIYYTYIVIVTAIIFAVAERECMVYRYETDRIYKIVLSTIGCVITILFNLYTMYKADSMDWNHQKIFHMVSYIMNIYIIIILIKMYIPIINNTDKYIWGLFRTIQNNLFTILCLQWFKISFIGNYRKKVKEYKTEIRMQGLVMSILFVCLLYIMLFMFVFGWSYKRQTFFVSYNRFLKSSNKYMQTYFLNALPESTEKARYLRFETHFDNKSVLTFFCNENDMKTYVEQVTKSISEDEQSCIYFYNNEDNLEREKNVLNLKIIEDIVQYFSYNIGKIKNIGDFEIVIFKVKKYSPGVYICGTLVNYETGQIIHFADWNMRDIKQEEWIELVGQD